MKKLLLIPVIISGLAACTQLSEEDRATITSANQAAQQAVVESRQAREAAEKAAAEAKAASDKADRIFRTGQNK